MKEGTAIESLKAWFKKWWKRGLIFFAGAALGWIVGRLFPPFVLDDPFWRDFWSGPPVAGLFALGGAGIAFGAAWIGARTSRMAAKREEWWDRAEWALTLAMSDRGVERIVGLEALTAMKNEATITEYEIILAVTEAVSGEGVKLPASDGDVDTPPQLEENESKGGASRWLKGLTRLVRSKAE